MVRRQTEFDASVSLNRDWDGEHALASESNPPVPIRMVDLPLAMPLLEPGKYRRIWLHPYPPHRFIAQVNDVGRMILFFNGHALLRAFFHQAQDFGPDGWSKSGSG
jgi:hypothetical protein